MTIAIGSENNTICDESLSILSVPLVKVNPQNFKPYGYFVTDFKSAKVQIVTWPQTGFRPIDEGTGRGGGVTEGHFEIFREGNECFAHNHAVDGHYITGWYYDPRFKQSDINYQSIYTREANYHPDGGQVFFALDNQPFVLLLALPGDEVKPEDFVAFYCDGSVGLHINAGIWHQPPFPIHDQITFLDKQSKVHACVSVDFVNEFSTYLQVPLTLNS